MVDGMVFPNSPSQTGRGSTAGSTESPPPGSSLVVNIAAPVDSVELSSAIRQIGQTDDSQMNAVKNPSEGFRIPSLSSLLDDIRIYLDDNLRSMREAHPGQFQRLKQVVGQLNQAAVGNAEQLLTMGDMVAAAAPNQFDSFVDGAEELHGLIEEVNVGLGLSGEGDAAGQTVHLLQANMELVVKSPIPAGDAPVILGGGHVDVRSPSDTGQTFSVLGLDKGKDQFVASQVSGPTPLSSPGGNSSGAVPVIGDSPKTDSQPNGPQPQEGSEPAETIGSE